ncbi:hypothetical protein E1293_28115 [Actinomadura darangshiensis]|uniref:Uncharacterized protein n=1 Tax=Actinomadura darangshiensis TaxID=705336 RepID=A0A4R5AYE3_9ACTN|nr:hypothetical protein [Actinomadura darangshiensis]TDD75702.1 hypothetical protein E1293_28115 [Actinomadura darangshiensis]
MHGQIPEGQGGPQPVPPAGGPVPPGGAPVPPGGFPVPPRPKRPSPLVWVAVAVAGVLVVGSAGFLMFQDQRKRNGPVKAEQCVDKGFGTDEGNRIPASLRVGCDDSGAKAKVLKITDTGEASGFRFSSRSEPDCPGGTDGVTNVRGKSDDKKYYEACVRNLKGPHPGDPGAGGAFLSVGDCVSSGSVGFGKEQPCSKPDWYGKVIARVDTEKSCPAQTLEAMKLKSFGGGTVKRPVLCLGAGGGVLSPGDCIGDPSFNIGDLDKAECGSSSAIAKVVGRVATTQECPSEATNYMTSKGAYKPVLCLKKLRPTLTEKLRSLPR